MRIAVTGCLGSVGKRVVICALRQKHSVVGIDISPINEQREEHSQEIEYKQIDLRDYDATLKALEDCEGVIHLAGCRNPGDYKVATHNINVVLSWNVLRAAAELNITRIVLASSVNVVTLVYSNTQMLQYFPIDEEHPCLPDEPYGLSKVIAELQADTIARRYPHIRLASIRLHWSVPSREYVTGAKKVHAHAKGDLWGYVQEDSGANAFLLALTAEEGAWEGHEAFFVAAPDTPYDDVSSMELRDRFYKDVPIKEGKDLPGNKSFFDCSKAERLLGWKHEPLATV